MLVVVKALPVMEAVTATGAPDGTIAICRLLGIIVGCRLGTLVEVTGFRLGETDDTLIGTLVGAIVGGDGTGAVAGSDTGFADTGSGTAATFDVVDISYISK